MRLYKAFDCKKHLDVFLSGNIRLGLLKRYRNSENTKSADPYEQINHYKNNYIDEYKELGNNVYTLCTSTNSNFIKFKFGQYIAEITDLDLFKTELLKAVEQQKIALHMTSIQM
jgi:hypothetical protein